MWNKPTHKVRVTREVEAGKSRSGVVQKAANVILDNFACDLLDRSEQFYVAEHGMTVLTDKLLTCNGKQDIQAGDVVIDLATNIKYEVLSALYRPLLPHMEVTLKGGVS